MAFSLLGSSASRIMHLDPGPIAPVTALATLLVGAAAALAPSFHRHGRQVGWAALSVVAFGAAVEMFGVATGWPFGRYHYTTAWWPTALIPGVGHFPLQVPIAWSLMAGAAYLATGRVWLAGLLAAVLDLVMEPVMVQGLGYWKWDAPGPLPGGAPVSNFVGWLITATVAAAIFHRLARVERPERDAAVVLAGHLALTLGIGAISRI